MVYSGKPSSSCHACRLKRLKCDKVPSGCGQCARKSKHCPGYRSAHELRVRDETSRVTRKANGSRLQVCLQKPESTLLAPTTGSSLIFPTPLLSSATSKVTQNPHSAHADDIFLPCRFWTSSLQPNFTNVITQRSTEVSVAYFMSTYITSSSFEPYLPRLFIDNPFIEDALSSAVYAAALATFAIETRETRYMAVAHKHYSLALSRINLALSTPEIAILDRTFAGVLLLGLFESVVFQTKTSLENWTAHTLGTIGLLQMRGIQQFQTTTAQLMFLQASSNIRTSCIQRGAPVPTELVDMTVMAMHFSSLKDATPALISIMDRVADIKVCISTDGCFGSIYHALELDRQLARFSDRFDDGTPYADLGKGRPAFWPLPNVSVRNPTRTMARYWNAVHMIRIFLNEVIWEGVSAATIHMQNHDDRIPPADPSKEDHFTDLKNYTIDNMAQIAAALLRNIPEFLDESPASTPRFSPAARSLIWPLGILQRCPVCPLSARKRALAALDQLSNDLNLPKAVNTAKLVIDESGIVEDKLHLYYLG